MNRLAVSYYGALVLAPSYGHMRTGLGGLVHLIATAAIWSAVSRLMRHVTPAAAVGLFAVACVLYLGARGGRHLVRRGRGRRVR